MKKTGRIGLFLVALMSFVCVGCSDTGENGTSDGSVVEKPSGNKHPDDDTNDDSEKNEDSENSVVEKPDENKHPDDTNDDSENSDSDKNEGSELSVSFAVGSRVNVKGLDYIVVANSVSDSGAEKNDMDAEAASIVRSASVPLAAKCAEKIFGKNVLLLRVLGKVTVPQGQKEKYIRAYNALVPETIPDGSSESTFFGYQAASEDTKLWYVDSCLVLGEENLNKRVGALELVWNSETENQLVGSDGTAKTFEEAFVDFSLETIRSNQATAFKTRTAGGYFKNEVLIKGGVVTSDRISVPGCGYYSKNKTKKPSPAASVGSSFRATGEWYGRTMWLCPIFGTERVSGGLQYWVGKDSSGTYYYKIRGQNSSTDSVYFTFVEDNTFTDKNVNIAEKNLTFSSACTAYDESGLPYTEEIRSVPVSFVLKEDGTVDFGEAVYAWARRWRDIIVEKNPENAAAYD